MLIRMNTDKIYITVVLCLKKQIAKTYPFQARSQDFLKGGYVDV